MILHNLLENNYDLNLQFHEEMRESIFCFAVAVYDEKLPFREWEKLHYGNYIEKPKKQVTKNSTPSSEHQDQDTCPSCGALCNIHSDLDDNDNCNDCRN